MMKRPIVPEFSGEEYLRWEAARPEKYELHFGFIVAFAGGTLRHNQIALAMRDAFKARLGSCTTFALDVKTRVRSDTYYYPDVVVVCGDVDLAATEIHAPTIAVEVLSATTQGYDLVDKRAAYRAVPSLKYFIIVHVETRRIEVDDLGGIGGTWRTAWYDDRDVAFIHGEHIPLDEIYGPLPTA